MSDLLILYASLTGTSEDVAETLSRRAAARGLRPTLACLSSFNIATLPLHPAVVFVVSTWGDGEFPPAGLPAWRFLARAALPPTSLSSVRAAVFGLGDRGYPKFNAAARKLWARLQQLGALPMCELGVGDAGAAGGVWGALEEWLRGGALWAALGARGGGEEGTPPPQCLRHRVSLLSEDIGVRLVAAEAALPCGWPFLPVDAALPGGLGGGATRGPAARVSPQLLPAVAVWEALGVPWEGAGGVHGGDAAHPSPLLAAVAANERLTAAGWAQDVRQVTLGGWRCSVSGEEVDAPAWGAGDVAVVAVENPPAAAEALAAWLGLSLDTPLRLAVARACGDGAGAGGDGGEGGDGSAAAPPALSVPRWATLEGGALPAARPPPPLPPVATLRALLCRCLDICGRPRRAALGALADFAASAEEAAKLRELSGAAGAALYEDYVLREARCWVDVLLDFPSLRPLPLAALLELVPRLRPRHYSIASAPPQPLQLCVALVRYTTRYGREKEGVASGWLAGAGAGARVAVWLRRGAWRQPPPGAPLLLVGPGTGVAPLRAVVQEEEALAAAAAAAAAVAAAPPPPPRPVHLFFGCRHAAQDHLYGEEMGARAARSGAARAGTGEPPWGGVDTYDAAFSRDSPPRRVYVQALLQRRGAEVRAALEAGAHVFIAGAANGMPEDVRSVLAGVLGEGGAARLAAMEREGRLVVEAWS
jgi:sulfite reductase alpha subunit-like flavoprotein